MSAVVCLVRRCTANERSDGNMKIRRDRMNAVDLYKRYSMQELVEKQKNIRENPANRNPKNGSIFIYKKSIERNLDAIAQAITWKIQDERERNGT
jgi:predicted HNH restriction endonuclease